MGEWDSHSYHALFSTATRQIAVSRTEVGRLVPVRMEPRKEFLGGEIRVLEWIHLKGLFLAFLIYLDT